MSDTSKNPKAEIVLATTDERLIDRIRPEWRSRKLIERVARLFRIDPSSACQRLLNAAIHDLRDKIIIAGIDIAKQAAADHKLPAVARPEDIMDHYSVQNVIDLSYRIGFINRPEWRRLRRCYEIRRDIKN